MTGNMSARKFTFDTVFEEGGRFRAAAPRTPPRRSLSESEIEVLCAAARTEGAQAAEVLALEAVARAGRDAAQAVQRALSQLGAERVSLRNQSAALALAMARKLAGAALGAFPEAEVENVLREALHQALGEPRVTLKTAPRVAEALEPHLAEIALDEAFEGKLQLSPDANLDGADCRIEWRGGGAERAQAVIETALTDLLERHARSATRKEGGISDGEQ
jgi:flagellar assembly protein FliH